MQSGNNNRKLFCVVFVHAYARWGEISLTLSGSSFLIIFFLHSTDTRCGSRHKVRAQGYKLEGFQHVCESSEQETLFSSHLTTINTSSKAFNLQLLQGGCVKTGHTTAGMLSLIYVQENLSKAVHRLPSGAQCLLMCLLWVLVVLVVVVLIAVVSYSSIDSNYECSSS